MSSLVGILRGNNTSANKSKPIKFGELLEYRNDSEIIQGNNRGEPG